MSDLEYTIYNVRKFVFFDPEDKLSDGYYVFHKATRNKEKAEALLYKLRDDGSYAELTERTITERRINTTHDTMPESF